MQGCSFLIGVDRERGSSLEGRRNKIFTASRLEVSITERLASGRVVSQSLRHTQHADRR